LAVLLVSHPAGSTLADAAAAALELLPGAAELRLLLQTYPGMYASLAATARTGSRGGLPLLARALEGEPQPLAGAAWAARAELDAALPSLLVAARVSGGATRYNALAALAYVARAGGGEERTLMAAHHSLFVRAAEDGTAPQRARAAARAVLAALSPVRGAAEA
jgi:hypothetical protein